MLFAFMAKKVHTFQNSDRTRLVMAVVNGINEANRCLHETMSQTSSHPLSETTGKTRRHIFVHHMREYACVARLHPNFEAFINITRTPCHML